MTTSGSGGGSRRSLLWRIPLTVVLAAAAWAVLGYFASGPLASIYGWSSGHPPIPNAPTSVYVGLYLVVLPLFCLLGAWMVVSWIAKRMR